MVETVLARDKNWVRWKIEGCQPIKRDPVSPACFVEAKSTVQRIATNRRLRAVPMGSVSLDFLRTQDGDEGMELLKAPERYQIPELDSFKRKIQNDEFEIQMPSNEQTKAVAIAGKASKSWRALRIAARTKLAAFDKIDDPKNISIVFEELTEGDDEQEEDDPTANDEDMPSNRDPVIISGPEGCGKSALVGKLLEKHRGVFASVVRHTTREPGEGEVNGKTLHFVRAQEFNLLRDGDRLIESGTRNGVDYGTSIKAIEAVTELGKVPLIELDIEVRSITLKSLSCSYSTETNSTIFSRLPNTPKTWTFKHATLSSDPQVPRLSRCASKPRVKTTSSFSRLSRTCQHSLIAQKWETYSTQSSPTTTWMPRLTL